MKTTPIPAQITTVEDKIAGNLNMTQIVLLLSPLFLSSFIYGVLPEKMRFNPFKIVMIILAFSIFLTLAIRIKERLILTWLLLLVSYQFRPHIFIFDKNEGYLREESFPKSQEVKNHTSKKPAQEKKSAKITLSFKNLIQLENLVNARSTRMAIKFNPKRRLLSGRF